MPRDRRAAVGKAITIIRCAPGLEVRDEGKQQDRQAPHTFILVPPPAGGKPGKENGAGAGFGMIGKNQDEPGRGADRPHDGIARMSGAFA